MNFFRRADAIRQRARFESFLTAYELSDGEGADTKRNIDYMTRALDALTTIKFGSNLKGLSNKQAKERMRELQLKAINSL